MTRLIDDILPELPFSVRSSQTVQVVQIYYEISPIPITADHFELACDWLALSSRHYVTL